MIGMQRSIEKYTVAGNVLKFPEMVAVEKATAIVKKHFAKKKKLPTVPTISDEAMELMEDKAFALNRAQAVLEESEALRIAKSNKQIEEALAEEESSYGFQESLKRRRKQMPQRKSVASIAEPIQERGLPAQLHGYILYQKGGQLHKVDPWEWYHPEPLRSRTYKDNCANNWKRGRECLIIPHFTYELTNPQNGQLAWKPYQIFEILDSGMYYEK